MTPRVLGAAAIAATVALAAAPHEAHAYEFWLRSQTYGQAYQLRAYKLIGPDVLLGRRRYTETLALRIWDIGGLSAARRTARRPDRGLTISWHSYLRIDHDFGSYANGRIEVDGARRDALDVIPELDESLIDLDLMYGYLEFAGIADDRVTARIGRLFTDDGWGGTAIDGGSIRVELPPPLAVTAAAGLRVRASSPAGLSAYELDGTAGAACREYVETAIPAGGTWKLIDRNRPISGSRFSSDLEYCPQRDVLQPTVAFGIQTSRLHHVGAELGYRRTWSSTVGLIGDVDRLDFPDRGLYPNEFGQAPSSGVNEERIFGRAHADLHRGGYAIAPYADARFSLLHAAFDRLDAGVRLARGPHSLEPTVGYFLPTFDGDSIFNAFSILPSTDARLTYRYDGIVRADATAWLRRYGHDETDPMDERSSVAGGVQAGAEREVSARLRARIDGLWDDGYGGRRIGGGAGAVWHAFDDLWLRGQGLVLGVAADADAYQHTRYVTGGLSAGGTYRLGDTAAIHGVLEGDRDALHGTQLRVLAILDLAFAPEL